MTSFKPALVCALAALALSAHAAKVGVSWSNFQEERWKTDEAAIKAQLAKTGDTYIAADAGGSPERQLADNSGPSSRNSALRVAAACA